MIGTARTRDTEPVNSRPARAKNSLKSKLSTYAIPGYDTIPGFLTANFPGQTVPTYRAMHNAIERYLKTDDGIRVGFPTVPMCRILFEGLI